MLNKGIAVKTLGRGFYSGTDIIRLHQRKLIEKKRVYFSTSIRVSETMAPMIEDLILFNVDEDIYYSCHVISAQVRKEKWAPDDSEKYSPEPFREEEERDWFLLDSISEIEDFKIFKELVTQNKGEALLPALQNSGRANAIYFRNKKLIETTVV